MEILISNIIVAALSLLGTLIGSYVTGNKTIALLEYRLKTLEEKVDKHNRVIERTYELEKRAAVDEERIEGLEAKVKTGG